MIQKKLDYEIDPLFKRLSIPISTYEHTRLQNSLLQFGCKNPIVVWNNFILDGHKRYEICRKYEIPFSVIPVDFICREYAVAWVCSVHLKSEREITDEYYKYLVGMEYTALVSVSPSRRRAQAKLCPTYDELKELPAFINLLKNYAGRADSWVSKEQNLCGGTVQKYGWYAKAINTLYMYIPDVVPEILAGHYKISHPNLIKLSKESPEQIGRVIARIQSHQKDQHVCFRNTRDEIINDPQASTGDDHVRSIKDMPVYDPDAEVTGLALTIPSWTSSIDRVRTKTNLSLISGPARNRLSLVLQAHMACVNNMLSAIKED